MNKNHRGIKSGILLFTLLFLMINSHGRLPHEEVNHFPLSGDTLSFLIIPDDVLSHNQYSVGYHYQILREFARDQQCALKLVSMADSISPWETMIDGSVKVMIMNADCDTIPEALEERFIAGPSINSLDHAWVMLKEDFDVMQAMYAWFNSFKYTEQYANITSKFYNSKKSRSPHALTNELSPYDDLIKKYSREMGWDWRLLAALIYQESNFRMRASSSKGAIGLMQVTKATAKRYGVDPGLLFDPEQNIKAGCLMLKDLHRQLQDTLMGKEEVLKFVLASYNAGPERIKDCRNFALSQGKNPDNWDEVVTIFPLMSKKEHYLGEHIKIGPFKGIETTAYVSEVLDRYQRYCAFVR
ncbi:MAG: transglycosylase SLT domain-containing protein [Bacteroidetes bacterium]|nr:transglycosylase SLT domain-containing protein [Bacteroidota bacterium]